MLVVVESMGIYEIKISCGSPQNKSDYGLTIRLILNDMFILVEEGDHLRNEAIVLVPQPCPVNPSTIFI